MIQFLSFRDTFGSYVAAGDSMSDATFGFQRFRGSFFAGRSCRGLTAKSNPSVPGVDVMPGTLPIESELARPDYLTFDGTKAFNIFGFVLRLSHLGPD